MKAVEIAEFNERFLQLMEEVVSSGEPIIITKNGEPVTQLVPYKHKPETLYGVLKGSITIKGDIVSPLDVEWNAQR